MSNINKEKLIYFYGPMGTDERKIYKNLEYLGINKNKKICKSLTMNFDNIVKENTYMEKYKDYDIIFLDEFYDHFIDYKLGYKAMLELINSGKQIIMAGHNDINSLKMMPIKMKNQIKSYDLRNDLSWDDNLFIDYIQ